MYSLVRRYLKTSIVFLVGRSPSAFEQSAHTHAILVGFVMMMILGVALWLFPRPSKDDARYAPRLADAAYWLVTVGAGRASSASWRAASPTHWIRGTTFGAGLLQVAGLGLFFFTMWSRIRSVGSRARRHHGASDSSSRIRRTAGVLNSELRN